MQKEVQTWTVWDFLNIWTVIFLVILWGCQELLYLSNQAKLKLKTKYRDSNEKKNKSIGTKQEEISLVPEGGSKQVSWTPRGVVDQVLREQGTTTDVKEPLEYRRRASAETWEAKNLGQEIRYEAKLVSR